MQLSAQLNQTIQQLIPGGRLKTHVLCEPHEISLLLYDEETLNGSLDHDVAQSVMDTPPFWSFCWASGRVFAQYILNHPSLVSDRVIVDFGAGSGIVGIAAAMAGARKVICIDVDPDARLACRVNADANEVCIETRDSLLGFEGSVDSVFAADIFYDRSNLGLLDVMEALTNNILIADSRLKRQPSQNFQAIYIEQAQTCPEIGEDKLYNEVTLYRRNPTD